MNWKPEEISFYPALVIRTPALPFSGLSFEDDFFKNIMTHEAFLRALYLANPSVFLEAEAWVNGKKMEAKREKKLRRTLFNYWARMHSNCTPFGFFANVSTAHWGERTQVNTSEGQPALRVDMDLLAHLARHIENIPEIRSFLRFYPNNTCYEIGDKIRYNEFYFEETRMRYRLSAVENSDLLLSLMAFAKPGKTIGDLCAFLCSQDDFTMEEVTEFIGDLCDAQLLFSELTLNVTGNNPIDVVTEKVTRIANDHACEEARRVLEYLSQLNEIIQEASACSAVDFRKAFEKLHAHFSTLLPHTDARKMLQVDCFFSDNNHNTISAALKDSLYEAIKVISAFRQNEFIPYLENFKKKFVDRYENAVMPLMQVLDTESGISFGDFNYIDENIFSSGISILAGEKPSPPTEVNNKIKALLYKKYLDCQLHKKDVILLEKEDFEEIDGDITKMASTCQVIFEHFGKDTDLIAMVTVGNSCAGNLISRFAHGSGVIQQTLKEIAQFEQRRYSNSVVAEIIHIPEFRVGNLTFRPSLRDFEIPIVTQSALPEDQQVKLEDLYVTVQGERIVLISKKLGKYVIPKLTNAHNYGNNTLPVYQFLAEMSYQHIVPSLMVDRGVMSSISKHVPRIQYKNVILSKAMWLFAFEDFADLYRQKDHLTAEVLEAFRTTWNIPLYTEYTDEASRATIIKWDDVHSVYYFLLALSEEAKSIYLVEFPFEPGKVPFTDDQGNTYNNQIIAFFMNNDRRAYNNSVIPPIIGQKEQKRNYFPCDEWVYFKVYCGLKTYNQVLPEILQPLIARLQEESLIQKWFFLPFNDPEFHLRFRFLTTTELAPKVIQTVMEAFNNSTFAQAISKVQLDTYQQELERYGAATMPVAESCFSLDSDFILGIHEPILQKYKYYLPLLVTKQVDALLTAFNLAWEAKYALIETIKNSYAAEFSITQKGDLKTLVDKKINEHRKEVEAMFNNHFFFMEDSADADLYLEALGIFEHRMNACFEANAPALQNAAFLNSFLRSIVHMHAIRCFTDRPRQNELFVYHALYAYYKKQHYTGVGAIKELENVP